MGKATIAPSMLVRALKGERVWPPPVWLMRQAGRYLAEYREVRERAGSFLDLCRNPELAARVTLQPIERFGFDAAIVFADILLVAAALGQELRFDDGSGPVLEPALSVAGLGVLDDAHADEALTVVGETVGIVRQKLARDVAVIGFCGGPWTVATYMVAGRASGDHAEARAMAYRDPAGFAAAIELIAEVSARYLVAQARAGAAALKIFDSWAGVLPEAEFARWVIAPTRHMVEHVRAAVPDIPIIGFPRGAGMLYERFAAETGVDAVALDTQVPRSLGRSLQARLPVQGNVDPVALEVGGAALDAAVARALADFAAGPYVFNLGHGIGKDTPVAHVARLVELVRGAPDPGG
jgi:uroporphyrinogen decarboxylase